MLVHVESYELRDSISGRRQELSRSPKQRPMNIAFDPEMDKHVAGLAKDEESVYVYEEVI